VDLVGVQNWFENVDGRGQQWRAHEYTSWGKPTTFVLLENLLDPKKRP
jgi:hypothetical protein